MKTAVINGKLCRASDGRPMPPKPPAFRYSCPACGPLINGKPHRSFMCRLMNGGELVGADDEIVFDKNRWEWRLLREMGK